MDQCFHILRKTDTREHTKHADLWVIHVLYWFILNILFKSVYVSGAILKIMKT